MYIFIHMKLEITSSLLEMSKKQKKYIAYFPSYNLNENYNILIHIYSLK